MIENICNARGMLEFAAEDAQIALSKLESSNEFAGKEDVAFIAAQDVITALGYMKKAFQTLRYAEIFLENQL